MDSPSTSSFVDWLACRLKEVRSHVTWSEVSGSLGDLGTFLPLLVGLTIECGLDIGTTLITTGLYNVMTGLMFDVPMPLQPMKTIAAVALGDERELGVKEIVAGGAFVSVTILFLGTTGLIDRFNAICPKSVVHGMQLGLGTLLCRKGLALAVYTSKRMDEMRGWTGADGLLMAISALVLVILLSAPKLSAESPPSHLQFNRLSEVATDSHTDVEGEVREDTEGIESSMDTRRVSGGCGEADSASSIPTALIMVVLGLVVASCRKGALQGLRLGPSTPKVVSITSREAADGIIWAGLPQLPLTTLNSVVAVCALSQDLFPGRPISPSHVATSVGLMNLLGCGLGAMPCCHGAGGLAAHYHFGARRGAAVVFLGACKLTLGVVFGGSLLGLLRHFPAPVLGVMLCATSIELMQAGLAGGTHGRGVASDAAARYVFTATAAATVATRSTGAGCAIGAGIHTLLLAPRLKHAWHRYYN